MKDPGRDDQTDRASVRRVDGPEKGLVPKTSRLVYTTTTDQTHAMFTKATNQHDFWHNIINYAATIHLLMRFIYTRSRRLSHATKQALPGSDTMDASNLPFRVDRDRYGIAAADEI